MAPHHGPCLPWGGASVNDGIDPHEFTLHYITVDQVIHQVSKLGPGALMAKFDVEAAYRKVPVHPSHRILLGMKWRDQFYVDDFITVGPAQSPQCAQNQATALEVCPRLGLPLHPGKCVGPLQCLLSWGSSLTLSTKWHVYPKRTCNCCKS